MTSDPDDPASSSRPHHVLLVEDNALIAMNTEALLREIGVGEIIVASSLAQALDLCKRSSFDFAFLDIFLGQETSIEVARHLRQAGVPFAFTSGSDDDAALPDDLRNCHILGKPYLTGDLKAAMVRR
jgi:CheY-like chemotaxis protein